MKLWANKQAGFTIVELLIVIVVIAILATISVVVYNGVQGRARDTARAAAADTIMDGLELYISENGVYPNACNSYTAGCNVSTLSTYLVPRYADKIPNDPSAGKQLSYVIAPSNTGYGLYVLYESRPVCKYLGGTNANDTNNGWWGTSVPKC